MPKPVLGRPPHQRFIDRWSGLDGVTSSRKSTAIQDRCRGTKTSSCLPWCSEFLLHSSTRRVDVVCAEDHTNTCMCLTDLTIAQQTSSSSDELTRTDCKCPRGKPLRVCCYATGANGATRQRRQQTKTLSNRHLYAKSSSGKVVLVRTPSTNAVHVLKMTRGWAAQLACWSRDFKSDTSCSWVPRAPTCMMIHRKL